MTYFKIWDKVGSPDKKKKEENYIENNYMIIIIETLWLLLNRVTFMFLKRMHYRITSIILYIILLTNLIPAVFDNISENARVQKSSASSNLSNIIYHTA